MTNYGGSIHLGVDFNQDNSKEYHWLGSAPHDASAIGTDDFLILGSSLPTRSQQSALFTFYTSSNDFLLIGYESGTTRNFRALWRQSGTTTVKVAGQLRENGSSHYQGINGGQRFAVQKSGNTFRSGILAGYTRDMQWSSTAGVSAKSLNGYSLRMGRYNEEFSDTFTGVIGWSSVLHVIGTMPTDAAIEQALIAPHLMLERYHPITGTDRANAVLVSLYGQIVDSNGEPYARNYRRDLVDEGVVDDTTDGAKPVFLKDAIGSSDLQLNIANAAGTSTPLIVRPDYMNPSRAGELNHLSFAQNPRACQTPDGRIFSGGRGGSNKSNFTSIHEIRQYDENGVRDRWPIPLIPAYGQWDDSAAAVVGPIYDLEGRDEGGASYHSTSALIALDDGRIFVDMQNHSNIFENPASLSTGDFVAELAGFYMYDPANPSLPAMQWHQHVADAIPSLIDPNTSSGARRAWQQLTTTYGTCSRNATHVYGGKRRHFNASGNLGIYSVRISDTTKQWTDLTANDNGAGGLDRSATKPWGVVDLPGGAVLFAGQPRNDNAPGPDSLNSCYAGLGGAICTDLDGITNWANWRSVADGTVLSVSRASQITAMGSPYSNLQFAEDAAIFPTQFKSAADAYFAHFIADDDGNLFGIYKWSENDAYGQPNDVNADNIYYCWRTGYNPATFTWANSGEVDISDMIRAATKAPGNPTGDQTGDPIVLDALNVHWHRPILQWRDSGQNLLLLLLADPDGQPQEQGDQYERERGGGRYVKQLSLPNPASSLGDLTKWSPARIVASRQGNAQSVRPLAANTAQGSSDKFLMEYIEGGANSLEQPSELIYAAFESTSTDFTSNLVAHYKLDETSGTVIADSSGNGHTATLVGDTATTMTVESPTGRGFEFDGTTGLNQRVNAPVHADFVLGTGHWSIGVRLKADSLSQPGWAPTVLGIGDTAANECMVRSATSDSIEFWSSAGICRITGLSADTWYSIVFTYDGISIRGYVDGVLATTTPATLDISSTKSLQIGMADTLSSRSWDGVVDEVSLWKGRALSSADAAAWAAIRGSGRKSNQQQLLIPAA